MSSPDSFASPVPAPGGGWGVRQVLVLLVVVAVWGGVFYITKKLVPAAKAERTWSAADKTPVPGDFLFLMFPVDDNVPLYDSPGGNKVGVLERALGNDWGELHNSQWVQVPASAPEGKNRYVRVEDLRYLSPAAAGTATAPPEGTPAKRVNYVANFAAAYMARASGESRTATFRIHGSLPEGLEAEAEAAGGEGRFVSIELKAGPSRRQFYSKVTAEKAVPLAIDRLSEGARFQSTVLGWIIAGTVATVTAALAAIVGGAVLGRQSGAPPDSRGGGAIPEK